MKLSNKFFSLSSGIALFMLLAYVLPWVTNANNTLDLNGYDLAEWVSLHPFTQQAPARWPSLLLRGQLLIIAAIISWQPFTQRGFHWWLSSTITLLLIVAQLPPLDFFTNPSDANQQQQFLLAASSAICIAVGLFSNLRYTRMRLALSLIFALAGLMSVSVMLSRIPELMAAYGLGTRLGFGGPLLLAGYILIVIRCLWLWRNNTKEPPVGSS